MVDHLRRWHDLAPSLVQMKQRHDTVHELSLAKA